jgi:hypothetical protein
MCYNQYAMDLSLLFSPKTIFVPLCFFRNNSPTGIPA